MTPERVKSIERFEELQTSIRWALGQRDFEEVERLIMTLRNYGDCFYCQKYRTTLESRGYEGCCTNCPIHALGQHLAGKNRSYNGCYLLASYRDMVKNAFWYREDPSHQSAMAVIDSIDNVLYDLDYYKKEL